MNRISIIGLGLIGGSLATTIKRSRVAGRRSRVIGIPRQKDTLREALKRKIIDEGTLDLSKGVAKADLVFICTPIHLILPTLRKIAPHLKKGAIVTDVGSTKGKIVFQAERIMPKGTCFVGGHPMAGKETTKLESAEPDLFKNKIWILTRTPQTSRPALQKIKKVINLTKAKVLEMNPKTHDHVVAAISHLPLAVAASLVKTVAHEPKKSLMVKCAASGFRDTTRLASGDPILGVDMFTTNQKSVLKMLNSFKRTLSQLEKLIKRGNAKKIRQELAKAKRFRDLIYG